MNTSIKFLIILLMLCYTITLTAQNQINLLDNLTYPDKTLNDIWGYSNGSNEYALVGLTDGLSVVDVTNPTNVFEVQFQSGTNSIWRDIKTWGNYAYVSNDDGGGIEIFNLSGLPNSMTNSFWFGNNGITFSKAHNLFIDESGILYVFGADYQAGGAIMADLTANPTNPPILGVYDADYCHDGYARNNILYTAEIYDGTFSIVDVSNKSNPVVLADQPTTSNFTHNTWLSDDGTHLFTTDERGGSEVGAYDISNLNNIQRVDGNFSSPSTGTIPHNTHVLNDCLVTSWYKDGVTIVDAKVPGILVEVGFYDTFPQGEGGDFDGCWGAYPFLPSGNILASDISNGLFVLEGGCPCASRLTGTITDENGFPINNATVTFAGEPIANTTSNIIGNYGTGTPNAGTYNITFAAFGYSTETIAVNLANCAMATQNIQLQSQGTCTKSGQITDATGTPIDDVMIIFDSGSGFTTTVTTNATGSYSTNIINDSYDIYLGKWGYVTKSFTNHPPCGNLNATLQQGYCDDFLFDFNWSTSSSSTTTSGFWELGEPNGTFFGSTQINPDFDVDTDIGEQCYVTGNGGGTFSEDDIDNGTVTLTTPFFDLSNTTDPYIEFSRWFFDAGSGYPDDELVIKISNGNGGVVTVETVTDGEQESEWVNFSFRVLDYISLSNVMRMKFEAGDTSTGHIVEAAIDNFCIIDAAAAQPVADFTISETIGCGPLTVTFNDNSTNNPTSWNWSFPGGNPSSSSLQNPTVTFSNEGNYNVALMATNASGSGATTTNAAVTVLANPAISFNLPPSISVDTPINLSATPSGGTFSGIGVVFSLFNSSVVGPGQYTITYTYADANGCSATVTNDIVVFSTTYNFVTYTLGTIAPKILGDIDGSLQIYPNPVQNFVEMSFFTSEIPKEDLEYNIYDLSGKKIQSNIMSTRDLYHTEKIDVSDLTAGTYILNISNVAGTVSKRIIKR